MSPQRYLKKGTQRGDPGLKWKSKVSIYGALFLCPALSSSLQSKPIQKLQHPDMHALSVLPSFSIPHGLVSFTFKTQALLLPLSHLLPKYSAGTPDSPTRLSAPGGSSPGVSSPSSHSFFGIIVPSTVPDTGDVPLAPTQPQCSEDKYCTQARESETSLSHSQLVGRE